MHPTRIAELLQPFLESIPENPKEPSAVLSPTQLQHISIYIDLLIKWNSRVNLTSVRQPDEIVTRHFGESLFTARHLFPHLFPIPDQPATTEAQPEIRVIDVGSGAGFPGLPIKIWDPHIHLTLIESNQKKATFLREVIRTLTLISVDVFAGRVSDLQQAPQVAPIRTAGKTENTTADAATTLDTQADDVSSKGKVVTLRAVEHFDSILPEAVRLLNPSGRLALLIGQSQINHARELAPALSWSAPVKLPHSASRVLTIGRYEPKK